MWRPDAVSPGIGIGIGIGVAIGVAIAIAIEFDVLCFASERVRVVSGVRAGGVGRSK
jgi:hypothetical protein